MVELPERPCPGCGMAMTTGRIFAREALYEHQIRCPADRERMAYHDRQRMKEAIRQAKRRAARLPEDDPEQPVGDLPGYLARFGRERAFLQGVRLAEAFLAGGGAHRLPSTGFTLRGGKGAGKSTLIAALARSLVDRDISVRFWSAPDLYNHLLASSRGDYLTLDLEELARVSVLFLDDLGREKPSAWWVDQALFPLVDARYRNGRPIIATCNRNWDELEERWSCITSGRAESPDSAAVIRDRLEERSAAVEFGPKETLRKPRWDFLEASE